MRYLLLLLFIISNPALAQNPPERVLDLFDDCPIALPDWATDAETFAWDQMCRGWIVEMNMSTGTDDQAGCTANSDEVWPESRKPKCLPALLNP